MSDFNFEFLDNIISLVHPASGKETFVLLNRKHTSSEELANTIHVSEDDVREFLHVDKTQEKAFKFEATMEQAKLRLICLLGFAGSKIAAN